MPRQRLTTVSAPACALPGHGGYSRRRDAIAPAAVPARPATPSPGWRAPGPAAQPAVPPSGLPGHAGRLGVARAAGHAVLARCSCGRRPAPPAHHLAPRQAAAGSLGRGRQPAGRAPAAAPGHGLRRAAVPRSHRPRRLGRSRRAAPRAAAGRRRAARLRGAGRVAATGAQRAEHRLAQRRAARRRAAGSRGRRRRRRRAAAGAAAARPSGRRRRAGAAARGRRRRPAQHRARHLRALHAPRPA